MEEEMNYLSENIEQLERDILETKALVNERPNSKIALDLLKHIEKRLRIYNNILSALTISELNKSK
jgi:hypothetical protein